MGKHLDSVIDTFVAEEPNFETEVRGTGKTIVEAGADFFGPALEDWEKIWAPKAAALETLRAEASKL